MTTRSIRANHHDLEVNQSLVWKGWEPGKEYTKNIVIKNVNTKRTKRVEFSFPRNASFKTLFPRRITLGAGTTANLPVTFRPLEVQPYEDKLVLKTTEGEFNVPVRAVLPKSKFEVPESIDFGMCACLHRNKRQFHIRNSGDLDMEFRWSVDEPFSVYPPAGLIVAKSSLQLEAIFSPSVGVAFDKRAICSFAVVVATPEPSAGAAVAAAGDADEAAAAAAKEEEEERERARWSPRAVLFQGVGKFVHLVATLNSNHPALEREADDEALLDFGGDFFAGENAERHAHLHNLSPVDAPFEIGKSLGGDRIDAAFSCPVKQGVVPAYSYIRVPFVFRPPTPHSRFVDVFHVSAAGSDAAAVFRCIGATSGPRVHLDQEVVVFDTVRLPGGAATFPVVVRNDGRAKVDFQFLVDSDCSAFRFETVSGVLAGKSHLRVVVTFAPSNPISYYRRVTLLVPEQQPVTLHLLGTAHDAMNEPPILGWRHVKSYDVLKHRGLSVFDPECLYKMLEARKLTLDDDGHLYHVQTTFTEPYPPLPPKLTKFDDHVCDGFAAPLPIDRNGSHDADHVTLDVDAIDFGEGLPNRSAPPKDLNVTNLTKGKITVQWELDRTGVFRVEPNSVDIMPGKGYCFSVIFTPRKINHFYHGTIEGMAFFKCLREHRNIEEVSLLPPWCLTFDLRGHTFPETNTSAFIPEVNLSPSRLVFRPSYVDVPTFASMILTNSGADDAAFDFEPEERVEEEEEIGVFVLKPSRGVLAAGERIVVTVMFIPRQPVVVRRGFRVALNLDGERFSRSIKLRATGETPLGVAPDGDGVFYFKVTCVGTSSERTYSIRNKGRVPINYRWVMKSEFKETFTVEPDRGVVLPNELLTHKWTFSPDKIDKFVVKPFLWLWPLDDQRLPRGSTPSSMILQLPVRAVGEGSLGKVVVEEKSHDLSNVVVGSSRRHEFYIYNDGVCDINFMLNVVETSESLLDVFPSEGPEEASPALTLEPSSGSLPARTRTLVRIAARPSLRKSYAFNVFARILSPDGVPILEAAAKEEDALLCEVLFTGVFPLLTVTDAQCHGSAMALSKKHVWQMFHIDDLNNFLDSDPTSLELVYSRITRHSIKHPPAVHTPAQVELNFVAAPLGSPPAVVHLLFENPGAVDCDFAFLYPKELKLEIARWAENGNLDTSELETMMVTENNLFDIRPKSGTLPAGNSLVVTLTFKHEVVGSIRLPVLLKLMRGREVLLRLIGTTTAQGQPYIHFYSNRHFFTSVPIGETQTVTQIYEMYNGGSVDAHFEIDTKPLFHLHMENYNSPVLECFNSKGTIRPGRFGTVLFKFSPLEAKVYTVDLDIRTKGGKIKTITFSGEGFDKRHMGSTLPITDNSDAMGLPNTQAIPRPGQFVFMSLERMSFGNLPLFSLKRKVLHLSNKSPNHVATFKWHVTQSRDLEVLRIEPVSGELKPGEFCRVKFTFVARGTPSFYDLDVICEITDETVLARHRHQLAEWEAELERQRQEFLVDASHLYADDELALRPPSAPRLASLQLKSLEPATAAASASGNHGVGVFVRYKTLPPIVSAAREAPPRPPGDRARVNQAAVCNEIRKDPPRWDRPQVPPPFLMHLGILARTHTLAEFRTYFPQEYADFHINRDLQEIPASLPMSINTHALTDQRQSEASIKASFHSGRPTGDSAPSLDDTPSAPAVIGAISSALASTPPPSTPQKVDLIHCNSESESEVVTGVLSRLLRGLVEDDTFLQQTKKLDQESLPYFSQYVQDVKLERRDFIQSTGGADVTFDITAVGADVAPSSTVGDSGDVTMPRWSLTTPVEQQTEKQLQQQRSQQQKRGDLDPGSSPTPIQASAPSSGGNSRRRPYHYSESEVTERFAAESALKRRTRTKRLAEVGSAMEGVVEKLIDNILVEAFKGEEQLTWRPMRVAEGDPPSPVVMMPKLTASGFEPPHFPLKTDKPDLPSVGVAVQNRNRNSSKKNATRNFAAKDDDNATKTKSVT